MITKIIITFIIVLFMAGLIYLIWFGYHSAALTIKDCTFKDIDPNGSIKLDWGEKTEAIDLDSNGITLAEANSFGFTCPKCQGHKLLFKPNPRTVTIKREVGATAEITGDWFCNNCLHPIE